MSYILNALRKSEKERQALKPETATDRILVQEQDQSRRPFNWKILLIVTNLVIILALIIAVFIGFNRKTETVTVSAEMPKPAAKSSPVKGKLTSPKMVSKSTAETAQIKYPKQAASETALQTHSPLKSPARPPSPTIAELAAAKQAVENPLPQKAPMPKETTDRQPPEPSNKAKASSSAVKNIDTFMVQAQGPFFGDSARAAADKGKTTGPALVQDDKIPFLDDLPDDFRHSVPRLTINVFVFTPQPSDRFVMINMVKYKTGDKTMDNIEIKEIRNSSLVVRYNGRTFQIARP